MAGLVVPAQLAAIYWPFMNRLLYTQPLPMMDLIVAVVVSSAVFWAIELQKWWRRKTTTN